MMITETKGYTPNVSADMTEEQWEQLENHTSTHLELDADDINELIYDMVVNGKELA